MPLDTIGTPTLWALSVGAVAALIVLDFLVTRRPHDVSMREAVGWSVFYISLPLAFGVWVWTAHGGEIGLQYYTGYLVEKTLSVDNLFVFMLLLGAFAVPRNLQQRVLLFGVVGALVLRGIFIALGAQLIASFSWAFLGFGVILLITAVKMLRDALSDAHVADVSELRLIKLVRRFMPVVDDYHGTRMTVVEQGRRALTPLALVVIAVLGTDVIFAIDSVPAVYRTQGRAREESRGPEGEAQSVEGMRSAVVPRRRRNGLLALQAAANRLFEALEEPALFVRHDGRKVVWNL